MSDRNWTSREVTTLTRALEAGQSLDTIELPGRTQNAIRNKASRLGLVGDGISRKHWSRDDERQLATLIDEGHSLLDIHRKSLLPYSLNGLRKKAGRLQLVDRQRSERSRNARRFNAKGRWYFHEFLKKHAQNCTPEQIAVLWNQEFDFHVSRRRVIYHLTRLGLKRPWSVVIRMPYSQAKRRNRSDAASKAQTTRWEEYRLELSVQLREQARELRRKGRGQQDRPTERLCVSCRRRWPARQPFFHATRKTTRRGVREYLLRKCRLCVNEERRERRRSL